MNDVVRSSIEARKSAFYNAYNIQDDNIKNKIEELFKRIMEFGESCKDSMEFESKFASSSLNQEYIDLFTKLATSCEQIKADATPDYHIKTDEELAAEELASEIRYQAKSATQPLRRAARQEAYDQARDIPIIGDILHIKQHVDFFSRFKKNRDEDKEKEKYEKKDKSEKK